MYELFLIWDWFEFALRWLHVITAIAWIGSSFYFIALDLGLRKAPDLPAGAHGEEWQVHRWLLPCAQIFGGPQRYASAFNLVQMGKLRDLAIGRGVADGGLLGRC